MSFSPVLAKVGSAVNELIKLYQAWGKPQKAQEWRAKLRDERQTIPE